MSTLILYGRSTSFNVQKVLWFLAELETPFEHIQYGGRHGGLDGESFSELNPMRKVPVLENGSDVVWESHTILRYLAAVFGAGHWHPEDPYQRSLVERWMDWSRRRWCSKTLCTGIGDTCEWHARHCPSGSPRGLDTGGCAGTQSSFRPGHAFE